MIKLILLFSVIIVCCGCSSTFMINQNYSAYNTLNEKLEGEKCEITLTNGDICFGKNINVWDDSISWDKLNATLSTVTKSNSSIREMIYIDASQKICQITLSNSDVYRGTNLMIGTDFTSWNEFDAENNFIIKSKSEIHKITYTDYSSAQVKGFTIGMLAGGGLGYLLGKKNESSGGGSYGLPKISGYEPGIGILLGAIGGIIVGTSYGAIRGDKEIYVLNPLINEGNHRNEIFTIEVHSIINETEKSMTVLCGIKGIEIPKAEIIETIKDDKKIYIRINNETYNAYFK